MKKIRSLFVRNSDGKLVPVVDASAMWVLDGEGVATRKYDGTAVAIINGQLFARYDAKQGKPAPEGFIPCQDPDPVTGHWPGWVRATRDTDRWIREAAGDAPWPDWTYEAVGPRIGANPDGFMHHTLVRHGANRLRDVPVTWEGLREYLLADIEGIVWWRDPNDLNCDKIKITGAAMGVGPRAGKR